MGRQRKRRRVESLQDPPAGTEHAPKRPKLEAGQPEVKHAILSAYYPQLMTLRDYALSRLPTPSKIRRRKISAVGISWKTIDAPISVEERALGELLDTTYVGLSTSVDAVAEESRWESWTAFSQKPDESYVTLSDGAVGAVSLQSEIVDFVIWLLFSRTKNRAAWPSHLLCDGFRRDPNSRLCQQGHELGPKIPGLFALHENHHVAAVKQSPWPQLLMLLGHSGERIMMDLLIDGAVFIEMKSGKGNYCQITGKPLNEVELASVSRPERLEGRPGGKSPSDVMFVRSRMLYARAALNARGLVHFGLRHIHTLNRCALQPSPSAVPGRSDESHQTINTNDSNTLKVMMYIFPRQFGLHNVFSSEVDFTKTSQRFMDYTLREEEIARKFGKYSSGRTDVARPRIPKRLRGKAIELVRKLQVRHGRCAYSSLLQHYCPVTELPEGVSSTQCRSKRKTRHIEPVEHERSRISSQQADPNPKKVPRLPSLVELATPTAHVSAYCQAVLSRVIPDNFWGSGDVQIHNKRLVLQKVDQFIRLRQFENLSLHEVMRGIKLTEIEWLAHPRLLANKTSQTDNVKRVELFHEFLYYIFDSFLIPLIRSNFFVTESNTRKYHIFFFRHDVWRYIAEPAMAALKVKMFEEVDLEDALQVLESRRLGFGQIRLLPKENGARPIMNLRRRTILRGNQKVLGPSINTLLGPINKVLQLEKSLRPEKLGSSLFSVGDLYNKIKTYKSSQAVGLKPFYFAKLDVQSAFDTIPQSAIVGLLDSIPQYDEYTISKHVEVGPGVTEATRGASRTQIKPKRNWQSMASAGQGSEPIIQRLGVKHAASKKDTIFVDSVVKKNCVTSELLKLLASHIQQNLVKIGKKYYRQKQGIPQGSVLSSALCNYFYADLEASVLGFASSDDCLLLRLIDDFLLITTDKSKAVKFVQTMHEGVPEYGVTVNPQKSLVNFDICVNGEAVRRVVADEAFPYCGTLIHSKTLDVSRDRGQPKANAIFDGLTVEYTRTPGQTFQRKVLNAFKIQSHLMFFDTTHNSPGTMLANIHSAFLETATKMWAYMRSLPPPKQPSAALVKKTVGKVVNMAYLLLTSKTRKLRYPGYQCNIRRQEVTWLAFIAFREVLQKKQSKYQEILKWLEVELKTLRGAKEIGRGRVRCFGL